MQHTESRRSLLFMLVCLTSLFIAAQLAFFFVHYQVSELIDSLANSSIIHELSHPIVLIPIITFILIQLCAYGLLIAWIWLIATATGELCKLSARLTYSIGIIGWLLACSSLLTLNYRYFPNSFFATPFHEYPWLRTLSQISFGLAICLLSALTVLAYINFFYHRRHRFLSIIFLVLIFANFIGHIYEKFSPIPPYPQHPQPNIILIGLDSLRPDFTGFFGARHDPTPHIDSFLRSAATFATTYTPLARTFPAWISVLTGQYPKHNDARNNLVNPTRVLKHASLAKELQRAGYETIYATDEKRFSNITTDYGFDKVIGPAMGVNDFLLGGLADFPLSNLLVNLPFGQFLFPYHYGNRAVTITYEPKKFLQLLRLGLAKPTQKPLFLAVHLCLSHWPFSWADDHQAESAVLPERYQSSVRAVDTQFGKLLQQLRAMGLLQHSIVVLLSDHGTSVGLPNDRIVTEKNYSGDKEKLKIIPVARLSSAPQYTLDFKHDYTINTAYGQGTDVLSLKQHRVLLAFKGFGVSLPAQQKIANASSLLDIAPTILALLHLPNLPHPDGISLRDYFYQPKKSTARTFFIETGASLSEIETDKIYIEKVVKHEIGIYRVNPKNGLLYMSEDAEESLLKNKQRAVLEGDWLLARYPAQMQLKLVHGTGRKKQQLTFSTKTLEPYFVLVNLKTKKWTIGLTTPFAKTAPVSALMRKYKAFYGDEV